MSLGFVLAKLGEGATGGIREGMQERRKRDTEDRTFQIQREAADRAQKEFDWTTMNREAGLQADARLAQSGFSGVDGLIRLLPDVPLAAPQVPGAGAVAMPGVVPQAGFAVGAGASSGSAPGSATPEAMAYDAANSAMNNYRRLHQGFQEHIKGLDLNTRAGQAAASAAYSKFKPELDAARNDYNTAAKAANTERYNRYGEILANAFTQGLSPQEIVEKYGNIIQASGAPIEAYANAKKAPDPTGRVRGDGYLLGNGVWIPTMAFQMVASGKMKSSDLAALVQQQQDKNFKWDEEIAKIMETGKQHRSSLKYGQDVRTQADLQMAEEYAKRLRNDKGEPLVKGSPEWDKAVADYIGTKGTPVKEQNKWDIEREKQIGKIMASVRNIMANPDGRFSDADKIAAFENAQKELDLLGASDRLATEVIPGQKGAHWWNRDTPPKLVTKPAAPPAAGPAAPAPAQPPPVLGSGSAPAPAPVRPAAPAPAPRPAPAAGGIPVGSKSESAKKLLGGK